MNNAAKLMVDPLIYDVTAYIKDHPAPAKVIVQSCGKDASDGWRTKGKARKPHSKKAKVLLDDLLKGDLAPAK